MARLLTVVDMTTATPSARPARTAKIVKQAKTPKAHTARTMRPTRAIPPTPPLPRMAMERPGGSPSVPTSDTADIIYGAGFSESIPMDPDGRLLLTVKEAARRLSISESLCWRLIIREELPSIILGARARRVPVAALTAFINAAWGV